MIVWCFQHPWMTFFIIMAFINALSYLFGRRDTEKEDKEEENE